MSHHRAPWNRVSSVIGFSTAAANLVSFETDLFYHSAAVCNDWIAGCHLTFDRTQQLQPLAVLLSHSREERVAGQSSTHAFPVRSGSLSFGGLCLLNWMTCHPSGTVAPEPNLDFSWHFHSGQLSGWASRASRVSVALLKRRAVWANADRLFC